MGKQNWKVTGDGWKRKCEGKEGKKRKEKRMVSGRKGMDEKSGKNTIKKWETRKLRSKRR